MYRRVVCASIICAPGVFSFSEEKKDQNQSAKFEKALAKIRVDENGMRQRWIKDEENWRKLPARAWPEYQPDADEAPTLKEKAIECCEAGDSPSCRNAKFDLATALLFNHLDTTEGVNIYESLAAGGDVRGMTALGVCLIEGLGVERNDKYGSKWLKKASDLDYPQGIFELASLYYTGCADPHIQQDSHKAFELFQQAARHHHTSGLYMVADMLLEGEGCEKDYARAVDLLYRAGERGHRFARSTLLRLLKDEREIIDKLKQNEELK